MKIFNYRAGPSVALITLATTKASEFVLVDYCEESKNVLTGLHLPIIVANLEINDESDGEKIQVMFANQQRPFTVTLAITHLLREAMAVSMMLLCVPLIIVCVSCT